MYCKNCGHKLYDDERFCSNCGFKTDIDLFSMNDEVEKPENPANNAEQPVQASSPVLKKCPNGHIYDSTHFNATCPYCKNDTGNTILKSEESNGFDCEKTLPLSQIKQVFDDVGHPEKISNPLSDDNKSSNLNDSTQIPRVNSQNIIRNDNVPFVQPEQAANQSLNSAKPGRIWKAFSVFLSLIAFSGFALSLICEDIFSAVLFIIVFILALPIKKSHQFMNEKAKLSFNWQLIIIFILIITVSFIFIFHLVRKVYYKKVIEDYAYTNDIENYSSESDYDIYSENDESTTETSEYNYSTESTTDEYTTEVTVENSSSSDSITNYFTIPDINIEV